MKPNIRFKQRVAAVGEIGRQLPVLSLTIVGYIVLFVGFGVTMQAIGQRIDDVVMEFVIQMLGAGVMLTIVVTWFFFVLAMACRYVAAKQRRQGNPTG